MDLRLDSLVMAEPSTPSAEIDGEIVLLDFDSGRYFSLEAVAGEIWRAIEAPRRIDMLCDDLAASYDVPLDRVRSTVLPFLSSLADKRLITVDPA